MLNNMPSSASSKNPSSVAKVELKLTLPSAGPAHHTTTRFISVPASPCPTWDEFLVLLRERFQLDASTPIIGVTYRDTEDDEILLSSDAELQDWWSTLTAESSSTDDSTITPTATTARILIDGQAQSAALDEEQIQLLGKVKSMIQKDHSFAHRIGKTIGEALHHHHHHHPFGGRRRGPGGPPPPPYGAGGHQTHSHGPPPPPLGGPGRHARHAHGSRPGGLFSLGPRSSGFGPYGLFGPSGLFGPPGPSSSSSSSSPSSSETDLEDGRKEKHGKKKHHSGGRKHEHGEHGKHSRRRKSPLLEALLGSHDSLSPALFARRLARFTTVAHDHHPRGPRSFPHVPPHAPHEPHGPHPPHGSQLPFPFMNHGDRPRHGHGYGHGHGPDHAGPSPPPFAGHDHSQPIGELVDLEFEMLNLDEQERRSHGRSRPHHGHGPHPHRGGRHHGLGGYH